MKTITIDGIDYELKEIDGSSKQQFVDSIVFPSMEIHFASDQMNWQEATRYAAKLGDGWSLPTKEELQAYAPQLRVLGFTQSFWSSSTVSDSTNNAWLVTVAYGYTDGYGKDSTYSVVCVRSQ